MLLIPDVRWWSAATEALQGVEWQGGKEGRVEVVASGGLLTDMGAGIRYALTFPKKTLIRE
jgi:hypothetical protein